MKRILLILTAAAFLMLLTSCADSKVQDNTSAHTPQTPAVYDIEYSPELSDSESVQTPTQSPDASPVSEKTKEPAPGKTTEPTPDFTPEPTPVQTYEPAPQETRLPLAGKTIGIDSGHQHHGNHDTEPSSPGSDVMKAKVSSGTEGIYTHIPEYQVNLDVGLLLCDMLKEAGATVIMTRTTNDVDISNIERAQIFNNAKTDYAVRLHCDGKDDKSVHGAFMLVPTQNPYLDDCKTAAQILIDSYCAETGAVNLGLTYRSDQTGFNWCERMIINIEMGHLSNPDEDRLLTSHDYQVRMARGLYNGILAYFEQKG